MTEDQAALIFWSYYCLMAIICGIAMHLMEIGDKLRGHNDGLPPIILMMPIWPMFYLVMVLIGFFQVSEELQHELQFRRNKK